MPWRKLRWPSMGAQHGPIDGKSIVHRWPIDGLPGIPTRVEIVECWNSTL